MKNFPQEYLDLLKNETKAYLFLATTMPDGSPQVTPIWFNTDDDYILINTNEGRIKDRNMKARPNVALVIQDPKTPYRYIQIRGKISEHTTQGADEHINQLALKYDNEPWKYREGQKRIIFKIRPISIDPH
ncbi:MAG: TIGR03618 family F420-dependent PPOX class oxidoreductase [Anaerolineales bacterium]|nr:TIGR03618 family F420-dependent PPOX class oxidoreductase [Anaerolineales bacterium]MDP2777989.1 TIGR03618 family F420-dependent PPOX class oxidoreductase [Anaerolineales bacterium]